MAPLQRALADSAVSCSSTRGAAAAHRGLSRRHHGTILPAPRAAPAGDLLSSLPDASAVQALLGDLTTRVSAAAPTVDVPQLPPHFASGLLTGALKGLQQAVDALPEVQSVEQAAQQVRSASAHAVLEPLSAVTSSLSAGVGQAAGQAAAPLLEAQAQLQRAAAGLLAPEGVGHLGPHWGMHAVEAALSGAGQLAVSSDLHAALAAAADQAAALAQALPDASAAAPQAVALAAGQLSQSLESVTAAIAAASTSTGAPMLPSEVAQVVDDVRLVLAALPLPSAAGVPAGWPAPAQQDAAVAEVLARLAERLHATLLAPEGGAATPLVASGGLPGLAATLLAVAGVSLASASLHAWLFGEGAAAEEEEALTCEYDPEVINAYFARRPVRVMRRATQVSLEAAAFGLGLLADLARGGLERHEPQRAEQLRFAIERLGPAYVKVAQALSTRVDLLSPEYFLQIQLLQDRVPPFPCSEARAAMEEAFGCPVEDVFSSLSDKPVAAASLGQVYRAILKDDGRQVAVKVQRPGVLQQVALDLFLMRNVALFMSPKVATDWVKIMDAWAVRFLREMDYVVEADNTERFARDMKDIQGIVVPQVVRPLTSNFVLTTEWIEGEKLCESQAADVRELCNTLLTAYLTQLLETGFLHADPHPGNLLRTPEGRIAVLDYGLMTEVTEAQRWALLEYISHLTTQNWAALAKDLQVMGFIPESVDPEESGLVEPLGRVMVQLVGGGGAAKVNIDKVMVDLENLGNSYPISIPAFFALILRAFSVIEGIALEVDPDYSIVAECFPYLSRRLLADDSPRARALLREMLYGDKQRLDIDRLVKLADGFSAYTTEGLTSGTTVVGVLPPSGTATSTSALAGAAAGVPASSSRFARTLAAAQLAASSGGGAPSPSPAPGALARSPSPGPRASASPVGDGGAAAAMAARRPSGVDRAVRDALVLVFSRQQSFVQELLVEEVAAAVDALSARTAAALVMSLAGSSAQQLPGGSFPALPLPFPPLLGPSSSQAEGGGAAALALPFPLLPLPLLPPRAAAALQPLVELSDEDVQALAVVQGIMQLVLRAASSAAVAGDGPALAAAGAGGGSTALLARSGGRSVSPEGVVATLADVRAATLELAPILPQLAPGLANTSVRLVAALRDRAQARLRRAVSNSSRGASRGDERTSSSSRASSAGGERADSKPAEPRPAAPAARNEVARTPTRGGANGKGVARGRSGAGEGGSWWAADSLLGGGMRIADISAQPPRRAPDEQRQ